jgi:hypothetical protein
MCNELTPYSLVHTEFESIRSATEALAQFIRTPKVHYRIHKSLPHMHTLLLPDTLK